MTLLSFSFCRIVTIYKQKCFYFKKFVHQFQLHYFNLPSSRMIFIENSIDTELRQIRDNRISLVFCICINGICMSVRFIYFFLYVWSMFLCYYLKQINIYVLYILYRIIINNKILFRFLFLYIWLLKLTNNNYNKKRTTYLNSQTLQMYMKIAFSYLKKKIY